MYKIVKLLVLLTLSVISFSNEMFQKPREDCPCYLDVYDPICASNGETFSNSCYLNCARKTNPGLLGVCHGECPCCKKEYMNEPLRTAGSGWGNRRSVPNDWRQSTKSSYPNEYSGISGRGKDGASTMVEEIDGCPCPKIFKPVCGSDGTTFANDCLLKCQQETSPCLTQACPGECPCCSCKKETANYLSS